ncbi:PAAR domain-containing protein [Paraburkholderia acidipaludis]|uniref:hypothetical protein n=1 Tax=Paraburkholderia acidipaludis TaxID=660537 RepID=UPI000483F2B0|nr:hypothetical protein [Paraburkholderia acidipaludis]
MQPEAVASKPAPSRAAIWGMPLAALVLAIAALLLVWFGNDRPGIADGAPRTRLLIGIPIVLVVVVIAHLFAVSTGAYGGAARLFRSESGGSTKASKPLKRDVRLQHVYEELRVSHGWRWQRRLRWLLLNGTDECVDQVAPGLKQAGVMHVGETVLVHASPDGIEAAKWLGQIRRLRRRPVDGVVHVACADDMDTELPRTLSGIATSLGWAAPVAFLHPVEAKGNPSERFDENDLVWCFHCQTNGRIACVGPRVSSTGPAGRQQALSDDLCQCRCSPLPRLVASQTRSYCEA